jgi:hypothetical protein
MREVQTAKTEIWRAYRLAFEEFSQSVRRVQDLTARPIPDRAAVDAALLEVESARAIYRNHRDVLAQSLLQSPNRESTTPATRGLACARSAA